MEVLDRVKYMAQVAKTQAMKTTLQAAAKEIESLRAELETVKRKHSSLEDEIDRKREAYAQQVSGLMSNLTTCQQQRDELVEALEYIQFTKAIANSQIDVLFDRCISTANAALAKLGADK